MRSKVNGPGSGTSKVVNSPMVTTRKSKTFHPDFQNGANQEAYILMASSMVNTMLKTNSKTAK
eukprot:CAMPEP_0115360080 /NCGR_PEP_ID=MMETSP0270-20121206/101505_1 /TAXON_ID=71861 /ORGANISM="Scrippsiella trochoidea, Strain CCMP3099" /LENGTH=62 /DNA_ID=CAMNT_0002782609 /DNA_START=38 /DNA_END=223 /DNA_ORIENTATION=-